MGFEELLRENYDQKPSDECKAEVLEYIRNNTSMAGESLEMKRLIVHVANGCFTKAEDLPKWAYSRAFTYAEEGIEEVLGEDDDLVNTLESCRLLYHFFGEAMGPASKLARIYDEETHKASSGGKKEWAEKIADVAYDWAVKAYSTARMATEYMYMFSDIKVKMTEDEFKEADVKDFGEDDEYEAYANLGHLAGFLWARTQQKKWAERALTYFTAAAEIGEFVSFHDAARMWDLAGNCHVNLKQMGRAQFAYDKCVTLARDVDLHLAADAGLKAGHIHYQRYSKTPSLPNCQGVIQRYQDAMAMADEGGFKLGGAETVVSRTLTLVQAAKMFKNKQGKKRKGKMKGKVKGKKKRR